jgi:hypothetical protein
LAESAAIPMASNPKIHLVESWSKVMLINAGLGIC